MKIRYCRAKHIEMGIIIDLGLWLRVRFAMLSLKIPGHGDNGHLQSLDVRISKNTSVEKADISM